MVLKNCDFKTLFEQVPDGSLYCYGVGALLELALLNFADQPWGKKLGGLIDRDVEKQGKERQIFGVRRPIISVADFIKRKNKDSVILITCYAYPEVVEQLNTIKELEETTCCIYSFMCSLPTGETVVFRKDAPFKIPPVIHYCWFGGKPLPDLYKRCIESWQRFCPEYEIIQWNEENCNMEECLYTKQAYETKKYGFVPDYFRLKIVYEYGGIYLDTDVELLKSLDDLRHEEAFCGLQLPGEAAFGLGFGAVKGHRLIGYLLETYSHLRFINSDGSLNETTSPVYQTKDLMKLGMKRGNRQQYLDGMCIYPTEVLSPINIITGTASMTEQTYAIHHFDGSWQSNNRRGKKSEELKKAAQIAEMFR